MRLSTLFKIATVAVVGLIVTVVVILYSIDLNDDRVEIAAEVERATGRKLSVAGELNLQLGLTPAITVADVGFANADWGARPEMVRRRHLAAEVELLALLRGRLRVARLQLSGLDVLLETDAEGRGNLAVLNAHELAHRQ